jgi:DNA-binding NarL/FixJ family response regulator
MSRQSHELVIGSPIAAAHKGASKAEGTAMIRIGMIEDEPLMRERLGDAIAATDDMMLCATAANLAEGRGMVEAGGYDVLLCDLGLPDGDGTALIAQEAQTGRDTDILVITVFANQNKVLDAIRAGARGYLLKDEEMEDCIAAVREIRRGGSPISPIIARQLLGQIQGEASPAALPPVSPLSEREMEVLNLLARGFAYAECADILRVSVNTVGSHVKNIYRKLEVNSRAEALYEANAQGLLARG